MNTVRKMNPNESILKVIENQRQLSLVTSVTPEDENAAAKMTKDYLNEKLNYFYCHGGPIMDI